jgi:hypothetical protein
METSFCAHSAAPPKDATLRRSLPASEVTLLARRLAEACGLARAARSRASRQHSAPSTSPSCPSHISSPSPSNSGPAASCRSSRCPSRLVSSRSCSAARRASSSSAAAAAATHSGRGAALPPHGAGGCSACCVRYAWEKARRRRVVRRGSGGVRRARTSAASAACACPTARRRLPRRSRRQPRPRPCLAPRRPRQWHHPGPIPPQPRLRPCRPGPPRRRAETASVSGSPAGVTGRRGTP